MLQAYQEARKLAQGDGPSVVRLSQEACIQSGGKQLRRVRRALVDIG